MSCLWLAGLFRLSCAFLVVPLLEQDLLQKVGLDKVDFERSASWQMIFLSKWIIFRFHWSSGNPFSMMDHLKCCSQRIMAHWVGRKHILVASQPLWVCTICCGANPIFWTTSFEHATQSNVKSKRPRTGLSLPYPVRLHHATSSS